jgi:hypothetical protein
MRMPAEILSQRALIKALLRCGIDSAWLVLI